MNLNNIKFIEKNKPATDEEIQLVNTSIKGILPDVYQEFLKLTNGAVLNNYVLYSTKDIIEMYNCYEFSKDMSEYVCIGNDNGDYELVIKAEKETTFCGFLDVGSIGVSKPEHWFDLKFMDKRRL